MEKTRNGGREPRYEPTPLDNLKESDWYKDSPDGGRVRKSVYQLVMEGKISDEHDDVPMDRLQRAVDGAYDKMESRV